ncbi:MAG: hypothetical protein JNL74_20965, partial [Fibrobacteres bacterium]|nr:hypothetical protein [Fibrobacterota bacterium]
MKLKNNLFAVLIISALYSNIYAATQHVNSASQLQPSVNQLEAGDTLYLAAGTYTIDTSLFLLNLKGTKERPIVIRNEFGQTPILKYDSLFTLFVHI